MGEPARSVTTGSVETVSIGFDLLSGIEIARDEPFRLPETGPSMQFLECHKESEVSENLLNSTRKHREQGRESAARFFGGTRILPWREETGFSWPTAAGRRSVGWPSATTGHADGSAAMRIEILRVQELHEIGVADLQAFERRALSHILLHVHVGNVELLREPQNVEASRACPYPPPQSVGSRARYLLRLARWACGP